MSAAPQRVVRVPVRSRRHGRIGLALIAYGLLGLGLIVAALLSVGGAIGQGQLDARVEMAETLDASRESLREAASAARNANASMTGAALAAGSAGQMMEEMSATLRGLAASLRLTIFGAQPFAPAALEFDRIADRAQVLAGDLQAVRASVETGAGDTARVGDGLERLEGQVGRLAESVDEIAEGGVGQLRLLVAAMLGWLAVPAAVSVWLGVRWARPRPRAVVVREERVPPPG